MKKAKKFHIKSLSFNVQSLGCKFEFNCNENLERQVWKSYTNWFSCRNSKELKCPTLTKKSLRLKYSITIFFLLDWAKVIHIKKKAYFRLWVWSLHSLVRHNVIPLTEARYSSQESLKFWERMTRFLQCTVLLTSVFNTPRGLNAFFN